jgi:hypothetical protein
VYHQGCQPLLLRPCFVAVLGSIVGSAHDVGDVAHAQSAAVHGFFVITQHLGMVALAADPLPERPVPLQLNPQQTSALQRLVQRAQLADTDPLQLLINPGSAPELEAVYATSFSNGMDSTCTAPTVQDKVRAGRPQPSSMHSVCPGPRMQQKHDTAMSRHLLHCTTTLQWNTTSRTAQHDTICSSTALLLHNTSSTTARHPSAAARHCTRATPPALQHDTALGQRLQHCSTTPFVAARHCF